MWMDLMTCIDFGIMYDNLSILQRDHPALWCIYSAVSELKMIRSDLPSDDPKHQIQPKLSYHDICCIYILNNVQGMSSKFVVDQYTSIKLKTDVFTITNSILSKLADNRSTSASYMKTTQNILNRVTINTDLIKSRISHYNTTSDLRKETWLLKNVQARYVIIVDHMCSHHPFNSFVIDMNRYDMMT
jgi:hypothetical protein